MRRRTNLSRVLVLLEARHGLLAADEAFLAFLDRYRIKWQVPPGPWTWCTIVTTGAGKSFSSVRCDDESRCALGVTYRASSACWSGHCDEVRFHEAPSAGEAADAAQHHARLQVLASGRASPCHQFEVTIETPRGSPGSAFVKIHAQVPCSACFASENKRSRVQPLGSTWPLETKDRTQMKSMVLRRLGRLHTDNSRLPFKSRKECTAVQA